MANFKLLLAYDGTGYKGFQKQPGLPTVQGRLEDALRRVAVLESPLYSAGRTDAGVHARGQVVSFHGRLKTDAGRLPKAANALLPPDIVVLDCREVDECFHARRSARAREYAYYFHTGDNPSPFLRSYALHVGGALDRDAMSEALKAVMGVHDLSTFCRREEGKSAVREVMEAEVETKGELLCVRVKANAFAWMMMRMLCGSLLQVGRGRWTQERFREALEARDPSRSGPALPPHGLFLEKVYY